MSLGGTVGMRRQADDEFALAAIRRISARCVEVDAGIAVDLRRRRAGSRNRSRSGRQRRQCAGGRNRRQEPLRVQTFRRVRHRGHPADIDAERVGAASSACRTGVSKTISVGRNIEPRIREHLTSRAGRLPSRHSRALRASFGAFAVAMASMMSSDRVRWMSPDTASEFS